MITASGNGTAWLWRSFGDVATMREEALMRLLLFLTQEECRELGFHVQTDCATRPALNATDS